MTLSQFIDENGKLLKISKHDHVFMQGDPSDSFYFVRSGLLKAYYVNKDGKESIKSFIRTGNMIGSLSAVHRKLPCTFSLIALKETRLTKIRFSELYEVTQKSLSVASEVIDFIFEFSMKKEQREYQFLTLSAEERYKLFCQTEAELSEQLTQNDIARYLGITPVALSRIKARLLT